MPLREQPDCYRHVVGLRAVRRFQAAAIPDDDVVAILEAGRWTGSARNRQAWAFVVMSGPDEVARLAEAGLPGSPLTRAPLAIALVQLPNGNDFDMGRAAQNMMLAAGARGIGSCPVTLRNQQLAADVLQLPEGYMARRAIAFGFPDDQAEAVDRAERRAGGGAGRRPLERLVHYGRLRD
ncbi:MAG: nitroreductase family protein [bacterium]|nr:nitroreductase family protein [bacterium]MDE0288197.1 nitroreductase family protein [bacterium]MDE0438149.1 nitroreductase family protein [bacterium]